MGQPLKTGCRWITRSAVRWERGGSRYRRLKLKALMTIKVATVRKELCRLHSRNGAKTSAGLQVLWKQIRAGNASLGPAMRRKI